MPQDPFFPEELPDPIHDQGQNQRLVYKLYESLGEAFYRHTVLEAELEACAQSITELRNQIYKLKTNDQH